MTQENTKNIFDIINNKNSGIILIPTNFNIDQFSSAVAFALYIKQLGKEVKIAISSLKKIEKLSFIPALDLVTDKIFDPSKITLRIKTNRVKAKELSYEPKSDSIEIYIKAADGSFSKDDVEIIEKNVNFDFAVCIGCENTSSIGLYSENSEYFADKDIINIDINNKNTGFGSVNFIDNSNKTLSEAILDLISFNNSDLINEDIATCLLTGIIDKTNGFKTSDISAETLSTASNLIDLGADKDSIFDNLFNKNLEEIKNNSNILANTSEFSNNIYFSSVENLTGDFDVKSIFFNEIINIKDSKIFVLFNKIKDVVYCEIVSTGEYSATDITSDFKSIGDNISAQFAIASPELNKVKDIVLNKISKKIK